MIRGPVLPQSRESLWTLLASRLDCLESGLELVHEGLDCSDGQLGLVECLARDAMGAPVLVLLAVDGDALLPARVWSACEFLTRVGTSLAASVPEANFCSAPGRVFVVGTAAAAAALESLSRLSLPSLLTCRLEPFRLAGVERFAVRWLSRDAVPAAVAAPDFVVSDECRDEWQALRTICERIDPAVRIEGDRFWRRISWRGSVLGQVWSAPGELRGAVEDGVATRLCGSVELRTFGDKLLRRYATLAGLRAPGPSQCEPRGVGSRQLPGRVADDRGRESGESLRSSVVSARLTPEEYSALGGLDAPAGVEASGGAVAGDAARIVAEPDGARAPARRPD